MKKILIIDDEKAFTDGVKINLETTGEYEVRAENEGKNALIVAKQFKPDLIFLDVIMPHIDGPDIMGKIKADEDFKNIPVIFLTAIIEKDETEAQAKSPGGYPFLAKPVSTQDLIDCIEKNIK